MLTRLGGIVSPIQSLYLSTATMKWPTEPITNYRLFDLSQVDLNQGINTEEVKRNKEVALKTRLSLTSVGRASPQSLLWTRQSVNCTGDYFARPEVCRQQIPGKTLANMASLPDPFLAQLPPDYSTGILRQYLLRINSTARLDRITESEFPADCDSIPDAFYVHYAAVNPNGWDTIGWDDWSLSVCMPANMSRSPWQATRDRQDFSEELYLNISFDRVYLMPDDDIPGPRASLFKITVDTTAGYFELPNYTNGQLPGPLLDHDPTKHCGEACSNQLAYT